MIRKRIKISIVGILLFFICLIVYVYGVCHGYFQLNNPSCKTYPVRGVDVSHYQGDIDWKVLSEEEIHFAYMKATEGSSHIDSKFADNWDRAKETELKIGAYHFFSFDSPGVTQAVNFITQVEQNQDMLPPVVDVEYYGNKKENPPEPEVVREQLQIMLDELENHYGKRPVLYSTEDVWEMYLNGYFDEYPLWIRNVITKPKIDGEWMIWQYTNRKKLKGYSGEEKFIDVNAFHGTVEEWEKWSNYHMGS